MPLPVITDVMRVAINGRSSNGVKWANVLHYRKTGVLTYAGAIAALDPILVDHLTTANGGGACWTQLAHSGATIDDIRYTPLDGSSATTVISHVAPGVNANEALPASLCLVVTLRTALRGRSHRGRVYQGPWTEAASTATGTPLSTQPTAVAAQWTAHLAALVGSGVSLVVASYLLATATDVATCTVDTRWDTQRRRLG